jgi:sirohydrochlorin ferrochelatase
MTTVAERDINDLETAATAMGVAIVVVGPVLLLDN